MEEKCNADGNMRQYWDLVRPKNVKGMIKEDKEKYLITILKKNAIMCFLIFQGRECFLMLENDKKINIPVSVSKDDINAVFYGQIVSKDKSIVFFINDILMYNKMDIIENKKNLGKRIDFICSIIRNKLKNMQFECNFNVVHTGYSTIDHLDLIKKNCVVRFKPKEFSKDNYWAKDVEYNVQKKEKYLHGFEKMFNVYKTNQIDVYKAVDVCGQKQGILSIVGADTSYKMTEKFKNKSHAVIKCRYSSYFRSWLPCV